MILYFLFFGGVWALVLIFFYPLHFWERALPRKYSFLAAVGSLNSAKAGQLLRVSSLLSLGGAEYPNLCAFSKSCRDKLAFHVCSQAIYKVWNCCPQVHEQGDSHVVEVCVSEMQRTFGVPMLHTVEKIHSEASECSMGWLSDGVHQAISSIWVPLMFSEPSLLFSQLLLTTSYTVHLGILDRMKKNQQHAQLRKSGSHSQTLTFHCKEFIK